MLAVDHPSDQETRMSRPIINLADLEHFDFGKGDQYQARLHPIGPKIGAQKLGYNLTVVPPGKRAFPFHCHRVNEEMFFILSGTGELRIGNERFPVREGDVIACPPGGPETSHQLRNTSADAELRYLSVSTMSYPEICEYPDSGKFGIRADYGPGPDGKPVVWRYVGREAGAVDYWDGE
jgi:uncharacterized cupin superfamily protein